ncbi:MAG: hypothetical protein ACERLG_04020 [Sedimentibacter sp.]
MNGKFKICVLILIIVILGGCKDKNETYVIPVNYTGEATVKVYTEKSENTYHVNIICRNKNYSIRTETENKGWNSAFFQDGRCVLNNDKFPESSTVIEKFVIGDSLIHDFDLGKFQNTLDEMPEEIIYWDGTYKHVLNFSKENLLPNTIFIYKNDNLVKTIVYEKINIEE